MGCSESFETAHLIFRGLVIPHYDGSVIPHLMRNPEIPAGVPAKYISLCGSTLDPASGCGVTSTFPSPSPRWTPRFCHSALRRGIHEYRQRGIPTRGTLPGSAVLSFRATTRNLGIPAGVHFPLRPYRVPPFCHSAPRRGIYITGRGVLTNECLAFPRLDPASGCGVTRWRPYTRGTLLDPASLCGVTR